MMGARGPLMGNPGARDRKGMGGGTLPGRGTEPRSFLQGGVSSAAVRVLCFAHHWWQIPRFNPVVWMDVQQTWVKSWITVPYGGCPSTRIHCPDTVGLGTASPGSAVSHGRCKGKRTPRALGNHSQGCTGGRKLGWQPMGTSSSCPQLPSPGVAPHYLPGP